MGITTLKTHSGSALRAHFKQLKFQYESFFAVLVLTFRDPMLHDPLQIRILRLTGSPLRDRLLARGKAMLIRSSDHFAARSSPSVAVLPITVEIASELAVTAHAFTSRPCRSRHRGNRPRTSVPASHLRRNHQRFEACHYHPLALNPGLRPG
jgi:hypothetical protein